MGENVESQGQEVEGGGSAQPAAERKLPMMEYFTPVPVQTNNAAVAGLVLGICSLVLSIVTGIPGIVLSLLGIRRARVIGGQGQALAIAGLVLSCMGTLLGVVFIAVFVVAMRSASSISRTIYITPMASSDSQMSATMAALQTLRAQTELYMLQHQDRYPTMEQMKDWSVLLQRTDVDGTVNPAGRFGPYLAAPPVNPLTGSSVVVPAGKPVSPAGWVYDPATGRVWAAVKGPTPRLPAADVVVVP